MLDIFCYAMERMETKIRRDRKRTKAQTGLQTQERERENSGQELLEIGEKKMGKRTSAENGDERKIAVNKNGELNKE